MNKQRNSTDRFMPLVRTVGLALVIATIVLWPLSHILKWGWDWGFTETSILLLSMIGIALVLIPYLAEFSLPGGLGIKLRQSLEEVQDTQLIGEVVYNRDDAGERRLFWIDGQGQRRLLPNLDTASLFATPKGFVGIGKDRFGKLKDGPGMSPITKDAFRRTERNNLFVLLDGKIFYLTSLSLPIKYGWKDVDKLPLITDGDFKEYEVYR